MIDEDTSPLPPALANRIERNVTRMRRIFWGEETYGDEAGTSAEQAARFRLAHMYDDIVAAAVANSADVERPPVDLLVSMSGFSPETTLLAFELVQPQRLLVISSEHSVHTLDTIWEKLKGRLAFSAFEHRQCDPVDPVSIYDIVRKNVEPPGSADRPRAMIDITGGKKVMSAGAALVASQLDLPMCYIESTFDPDLRQAIPGTETLCIVANATKLFGDTEMDAACDLFRSGHYSGAQARFDALSRTVSEPARARLFADLSALYRAWCDLDVANLHVRAEAVRHRLADPRSRIQSLDTARRLTEQLDFVTTLDGRDGSSMLLNFYLLGEHYLGLDRYDFAALLYYRAIEKSFSLRLQHRYGFDVHRPDDTVFDLDPAQLASRYAAVANKIFGSRAVKGVPPRLGLVDSLLLLHVVHDELLPAAKILGLDGIRHVRSIAEARNRSVLAHGESSVTAKQCGVLKARALCNLRAYWRMHEQGSGRDLDDRIERLRFVADA
jgi:CRISPR-associated protein (TIGR02710 family)